MGAASASRPVVATVALDRPAFAVGVVHSQVSQGMVGAVLIASSWHGIDHPVDAEKLFAAVAKRGIAQEDLSAALV
jgi:hypothetical protein